MTALSNPIKVKARSKPDEARNAKARKHARRPRSRKPAISKRDPLSVKHIGIGIDTGRYGHHVSFMHEDKQKAAESITVMENTDDYSILSEQLFCFHKQFPDAHLHVRIDAAGQYATNLEVFLRETQGLPITISVGEPKRNKDYHSAHAPKSQNDATESWAMARYAVIEKPMDSHGVPLELITLRRIASRLQATTKQTTRLINQFHETLSNAFSEFATIQDNVSSAWVLTLFSKYPTAERIGKAKLSSLQAIPRLSHEKAIKIYESAKRSVSSLQGDFAETLIKQLVSEIQYSQREEKTWRELLEKAYDELPDGPHKRIVTVVGIGKLTAAAIVASAISIERFESDRKLTGYYGVFPQELQSGVDKLGRPVPPGKKIMSRKGNDLVRGLLWQCAKSASMPNNCNPEVRALFLRRIAAGDSKQVAWGYCMTKLLRQVFGVWVTDTDFDRNFGEHGEAPADEQVLEDTELTAKEKTETESLGHTNAVDQTSASQAQGQASEKVVTRNPASLEPVKTETTETTPTDVTSPVPSSQTNSPKNERVSIDYAELRTKIHLASVLQLMGCVVDLGKSQQRLTCPLHGPGGRSKKTFSVNLKRNAFRCFDSKCGCQGNALDLYVAYTRKPLYEASIELTERLGIELPRRSKATNTPSKQKKEKSGGHTPPSP